jgi:WD40 repeat protein
LHFAGEAIRFSRDGRRMVSRAGSHIVIWEVALSREYRALPWSPVTGREDVRSDGGLSPDGHWLAVAAGNGIRLWDLASGRSLASLDTSHAVAAAFHPSGSELFTSGHGGLYRWPWHAEDGLLRIGPAQKLPVAGMPEGISLDAAGRSLAVAQLGTTAGGASLIDLWNSAVPVRNLNHASAVSTAVSPNGRWVATAGSYGPGVRIWDARSGNLIRELIPQEHTARASFSPDAKWLLTGTATEFSLWDVSTWQLARQLRREQGVDNPGSAAFTPDGRLLAVTLSPAMVELLDAATWRPLARLQAQDPDPILLPGFTPDGSRLVVVRAAGGAYVWDLRRIREELKALDLDWDMPSFGPRCSAYDAKPLRTPASLIVGSAGTTRLHGKF